MSATGYASTSAYATSLVAATALAKTLSSPLPPLPPPSSYDGHVYEPSDDTYLMVDAIAHHLKTASPLPAKVLEVGTGSGCNIVKAAQCLEGKGGVSGVERRCSNGATNGATTYTTQSTFSLQRAKRVAVFW